MHIRSVFAVLLLSSGLFAAVTPAIQLSPTAAELRPLQTKTFSVSATGGAQTQNLKWTLSGTGALGTFQADSKTYTAPPVPSTVTLKAEDPANAAVFATATITVLNPIPAITGLEPSTINAGLPYSVLIKGTGFVAGSYVQWDGTTVKSTADATGLRITGNAAPAAGTAQITVVNPDPGGKASSARTLTITQVQVQASPDGRTVRTGGTLSLSAKVLNNADQTVTWSVKPGFGSVDSGAVYHAPSVLPNPPTAVVTATSKVDAKASASLTINLLNVVPTISALVPSSINTGLPYSVSIKGTGFVAGAEVKFGDTVMPSTFDANTGSLTVTGTGTGPAVGSIQVIVTNPSSGGTASNARTLNVLPPIQVQLTPDNRTVRCGTTLALTAKVVNNSDQSVTWKVTGPGTVDASGVYTAPAVLPDTTDATVTATAKADSTKSASVTVHLVNPTPVITSISPKPLMAGTNGLTIHGTGFAKGAYIYYAGARMDTTWVSDTQLTSTSRVFGVPGGTASIKVLNPNPGSLVSVPVFVPVQLASQAETKMPYADAVRFLQLATWGPTPDSVAELMKLGRDEWLKKQFAMPMTPYPAPNDASEGVGRLQDAFFTNALTGQDQLRQRVAFALSQIFVVSAVKDTRFAQMAPYMTLLSNNAFGKFRPLMELVTKNPSMGYFLDMVNNDKANPARNTVPNENYARELLQLFTLGLTMLNDNGTPTATPPVSVYDENTVKDLAKVMTGWTYAPQPNFASKWTNPPWYFDPMVAFDTEHHDKTDKTLNLTGGKCTIAAGGTADGDLKAALDCIYKHPNIAPFISYRLIQRLVTSAPSAEYVKAVAGVFRSTDGDLQQVVTAILTHPDVLKPVKLNEPVLFATGLLRALNATVTTAATGIRGETADMGQNVLAAPSVFNYFSPFFRVSGNPAPEFQIVNAATDLGRLNFVNRVVNNGISGNVKVDLSNWDDLSANADLLIEAVNQALYRGEMTPEQKAALKVAIGNARSARAIVRNVLYVAAAAPQYQVQQ